MIAFQADPRVSLEYCLARSVAAVPVTEPEDAQLDYEDTIGVPVGQFALLSVSRLTPIQFPILTRCQTRSWCFVNRARPRCSVLSSACHWAGALAPLHWPALMAPLGRAWPATGLSQAW